MVAADPRVYIAFDYTKDDISSGTWTEITQYVKHIDTGRGRSYEFDRFEAGTATVVLDNADGRFTPGKTSSPYYPNVKPKRRLAIVDNANSQYVFVGRIEKWPVTVDAGSSEVTVSVVDDFNRLAGVQLKRPLAEAALALKPSYYFPLSDGQDATAVADWGPSGKTCGFGYSKYGGTLTMGDPALSLYGEGGNGGAMTVTVSPDPGKQGAWVDVPVPEGINWTDSRVTFMFKPGAQTFSNTANMQYLYMEYGPSGSGVAWIAASKAWGFYCGFGNSQTSTSCSFSTGATGTYNGQTWDLTDPTANYIVSLSRSSAGYDLTIFSSKFPYGLNFQNAWVAGYPDTTPVAKPVEILLGGCREYSSNTNGSGSYSNLVIQNNTGTNVRSTSLSDPQTLASIAFARNAVKENDYINKVANWCGTVAFSNDSVSQLQPWDWPDDTNALDIMNEAMTWVEGSLFIGKNGAYIYQTRQKRINAASKQTFKDSDGTAVEPGLLFESDDARVVNDATINNRDGATMRAQSTSSISEYGRMTDALDVALWNDLEAQDMADWLVYRGKDAVIRCDNVTVDLAAVPALAPKVLALEIGDKITLAELPTQAPYASADFFIEGIKHTVDVSGETPSWVTEFQLSPAWLYDGWQLDTSTLDNNTICVY